MSDALSTWSLLRKLSWQDALLIVGVLAVTSLLAAVVRWAVRHLAEQAPAHLRLLILRLLPIVRLLIGLAAVVIIVPLLIEPKFQNVVALVASVGVALAFAFKDYASCLVAGLATVAENTHQPGDWIEVDGTYGEVKSIGVRAVRLVTPDETEVWIPHSRLWAASIFNASSGNRSLLCVADFYLHPKHDAALVRRRLADVAKVSSYRKPETPRNGYHLREAMGHSLSAQGVRERKSRAISVHHGSDGHGQGNTSVSGSPFCTSDIHRDHTLRVVASSEWCEFLSQWRSP